jgi:hypothetical protein
MKYQAELVNNQGCVFDASEFNSIKSALSWSRGRGNKYKLILSIQGVPVKQFNIGK